MELKNIQDIERAIGALPPQELAELYAWLDRRRPSEVNAGRDDSGAALLAVLQDSPYPEIDLAPARDRVPVQVRDIVL